MEGILWNGNCKECGLLIEKGKHALPGFPIMGEEAAQYYAILECAGCGSKVSWVTAKEQGFDNWRVQRMTRSIYCPGCVHALTS